LSPSSGIASSLNFISDPEFYALAIPAVLLTGLSKSGFSGIGTLSGYKNFVTIISVLSLVTGIKLVRDASR
jgi:hypothetical protein